jgi:hypothetical protein
MDRQQRLDGQAVVNLKLNLDCRDEILPLLMALQHLDSPPKLRDDILRAVAADVHSDSRRKRGRQRMDDGPIRVLAGVRLGCNLDDDRLQNLAEQHRDLRQIMGIGDWDEQARFDGRRIRDHVTLVRPETLQRINPRMVGEEHRRVPQAVPTARADSFVMASHLHDPTESRLMRDGLRNVLESGAAMADLPGVSGWRQRQHLYRKLRRRVREIDRVAARKGNGYPARLPCLDGELLDPSAAVLDRAQQLRSTLKAAWTWTFSAGMSR